MTSKAPNPSSRNNLKRPKNQDKNTRKLITPSHQIYTSTRLIFRWWQRYYTLHHHHSRLPSLHPSHRHTSPRAYSRSLLLHDTVSIPFTIRPSANFEVIVPKHPPAVLIQCSVNCAPEGLQYKSYHASKAMRMEPITSFRLQTRTFDTKIARFTERVV